MALQQPLIQSSTLPPAQPVYILRGHSAQIHAVHLFRNNLRLLTGDADGWVILWSMTIKRPVAVWKPHNGPILGLGSWGNERIITHGRDNKLCVWELREEAESAFSTTLPIDDTVSERKAPWLLHSLAVNTLNFCSFAMCQGQTRGNEITKSAPIDEVVLIATPGVEDGYINITSLPSENRLATIPSPPNTKTGMIMAISLSNAKGDLTVVAGYESGHVAIWRQDLATMKWQVRYLNKTHAQPILSLAITPSGYCFFSSSADAIIACHTILPNGNADTKTVQTKHAGQQSIAVRSDERIFSTAGWDGRVRVYSVQTMKELAVLKWHREGCYATAFATIPEAASETEKNKSDVGTIVKRDLSVSEQRIETTKSTHRLAAGSKDGKVSLWDIY